MQPRPTPNDVSAVICTMNSISGIEQCLTSLRNSGVGEIIVVDANSTDGTREIADKLADLVLTDQGSGLGAARNLGITFSTKELVLNMGSDNVMPPHQLEIMIDTLFDGNHHGVSAQTRIEGDTFIARGLNAWRTGRFLPGPAKIIGTPTLFLGEVLRNHPYDSMTVFSDDSELCERWSKEFDATFAISPAVVTEVGKVSWDEIKIRCAMYGKSDHEVFSRGSAEGWNLNRKIQSVAHPIRADFLTPVRNLPINQAIANTPFLLTFTTLRYRSWFLSRNP